MEPYETNIVEEVRDSVVDKAMRDLRKNVEFEKRARRRFIRRISMGIMVCLIAVSIPLSIILTKSNNGKDIWWNLLENVNAGYEKLDKESIISIDAFNKQNKASFCYLNDIEKKDSYLLKYDDKVAGLEEHYIYNSIEIDMYIWHKKSNIDVFQIGRYLKTSDILTYRFSYSIIDDYFYSEMISDYKYQFKIHTSNIEVVEEIIGFFK